MTPFARPDTEAQEAYNRSHKSSRNVIERAFGVLKQRYRVLDSSTGAIMSSPEKVSLIIMACVCLHNLSIQRRQELDIDQADLEEVFARMREEDRHYIAPREIVNPLFAAGVAKRNEIVQRYF